ncbi:MAG: hypothetical protein U1F24_13320 [Alphaproteobacteria bacterium]
MIDETAARVGMAIGGAEAEAVHLEAGRRAPFAQIPRPPGAGEGDAGVAFGLVRRHQIGEAGPHPHFVEIAVVVEARLEDVRLLVEIRRRGLHEAFQIGREFGRVGDDQLQADEARRAIDDLGALVRSVGIGPQHQPRRAVIVARAVGDRHHQRIVDPHRLGDRGRGRLGELGRPVLGPDLQPPEAVLGPEIGLLHHQRVVRAAGRIRARAALQPHLDAPAQLRAVVEDQRAAQIELAVGEGVEALLIGIGEPAGVLARVEQRRIEKAAQLELGPLGRRRGGAEGGEADAKDCTAGHRHRS